MAVFCEPEAPAQAFVVFVVFDFSVVGQGEKPELPHVVLVLFLQFSLEDDLTSGLSGFECGGSLPQHAFFDAYKVIEGSQTARPEFFGGEFLLKRHSTLVQGVKIYLREERMRSELLEIYQSCLLIHLEELVDEVLGMLTCIRWELEVSIQDLFECLIFMASLERDCAIQ